jgi:hypothetical protein
MKVEEPLFDGEWGMLATIERKNEKPQFPKSHTLKLDSSAATLNPLAADWIKGPTPSALARSTQRQYLPT